MTMEVKEEIMELCITELSEGSSTELKEVSNPLDGDIPSDPENYKKEIDGDCSDLSGDDSGKDDCDAKEMEKMLPYSCQLCGSRFSRKLGIELHNAGKLNCDYCGIVFCSFLSMKNHSCVPPPSPPKLACGDCGKLFNMQKYLEKHQSKGTCNEKSVPCHVCDKMFLSIGLRNKHMITHSTEKPYICAVCGKCFAMKNRLKAHETTHLGMKMFQCDICAKAFSSAGTLSKHQKVVHVDILGTFSSLPFECKLCDKRFIYERLLIRHMISHGGEKSFECELCNKKFMEKSNLKAHHLSCHSDLKPFMCDKCCGKFSRKSTLVKHKCWVQLANRPFTCMGCCKSFSRKSYISVHKCVNSIHANTLNPDCQGAEDIQRQKRKRKRKSDNPLKRNISDISLEVDDVNH